MTEHRQIIDRMSLILGWIKNIAKRITLDSNESQISGARKRIKMVSMQGIAEIDTISREIVRSVYNQKKNEMTKRLKRIGYKKDQNEKIHGEAITDLMTDLSFSLIKMIKRSRMTAGVYFDLIERAQHEYTMLKNVAKAQEFSETDFENEIDDLVTEDLKVITRYTKDGYPYNATKSLGEIKTDLKRLFEETFGKFDTIIIGERMYQVSYYLEMVARTKIIDILTQATLKTCAQWGDDLVQFSTHDSPCEACAELEGQIFSISGTSEQYPELTSEETPPIHPNCAHGLNAVPWSQAND